MEVTKDIDAETSDFMEGEYQSPQLCDVDNQTLIEYKLRQIAEEFWEGSRFNIDTSIFPMKVFIGAVYDFGMKEYDRYGTLEGLKDQVESFSSEVGILYLMVQDPFQPFNMVKIPFLISS